MRRNIDGTCSTACRNPNIRTINTMSADTVGNFTIRGGQGIHVTVGTNEIIISGIAAYYDNTDGNIVIDNDQLTIDLADDISITGDMIIAGDLTVNGTYYTVHAEHVYTEDDYIIMRNGAVTGLGSGDFSGFQVKLYDGVNDGRLVIDNSGTARVGDVGDEEPLLTRDEAADLTDGALLKWDAGNFKAINEGTVGSDNNPIKLVNGVATPISDVLTFSHYNFGSTTLANNDTDYNVTLSQNTTPNLNSDLMTRSNNEFTAQVDGVISFSFNGYLSSSSSTRLGVSIYLNGSRYDTFSAYCTQDTGVCLSDSLYLSAGDKIKFMMRAIGSNNVCGGGNLSVIFRAL